MLSEMSETVTILGAGASAAAGAPLMSDFLDRANDLLKSGRLDNAYREEFAAIAQARIDLEAAAARGTLSPAAAVSR